MKMTTQAVFTLDTGSQVTLEPGSYCPHDIPELVNAHVTQITITKYTKVKVFNGAFPGNPVAYQQYNVYEDEHSDSPDLYAGTRPIILVGAINQNPTAPSC